ncbi:GntR family transcriptional regulator [Streptococcus zalophi]|uniref:GntR family transcriptional regulator n=1 Tax=Streptococcus zalophi TaxID=640031 RepID=UPI00215D24B4|nr:GntR family transcriptional regulator [Streptococcus zalophi]MCR8967601.1 GntR family transcriptional regulator [Streptococcus zalophi]
MKIPKYQMIQDELRQQIINGKFENGDRFYTELELREIYKVSSITVIRAMNELVKDGYLVRQQGKGTFVSRSRKGKLVGFSDIELFPLKNDSVTVLSIEKGNDPDYIKKLELGKNDYYYKIVRLRKDDKQPYIYQQSYIPARYILNPNKSLSHYNSIYKRFREDFNIHMSEEPFVETNEVSLPTPKHIASALKLKPSEPSIKQIKLTNRSNSAEILEYIESYKHWKYFKFEITANEQ